MSSPMLSANSPATTATPATTAAPAAPEAAALSPLKRAFLALEDARAKLAAEEARPRAPVAVIGLGCRVPGADNPDELWQLLSDGRDAVGPIPRERFDIEAFFNSDSEVPGCIAVREAGFLRGPVDGFDAGFFGISPREARGMDPQQRLLLEVAWEALEHAGIAPDRLANSPTGVYVGQASSDYELLMHKADDTALLDSHFTSGVAKSVSSGRISYLLGLQGPSLTVDTACSSSLVAVHLACQALRSGECRMALAGGVNLMLSEDLFIAFSHSRMLAKDGRCKAFDAAADGFGRGEGCGVVVLKLLADAQADGDRILAVVRGSAVNQDGPSSGLTAPNGPAQEAVIRSALAQAGVKPSDIGCIEAHGTGTQLGDPLEVQALGLVFGPGRKEAGAPPIALASIKANVGHLEAAAGITGLIKLVLALQHEQIPAHLHFKQPSPHIDWAELPFEVPTAARPWLPIGGRRLAGVSSFGYSGTNVHVVVEQAPSSVTTQSAPAAATATPYLYTLSTREQTSMRELAARHARALAELPEAALARACQTANAGRAQFAHRAAITAASMAELHTRLSALASGQPAPGLRQARVARRDPPRVAFVFTGQGSQYAGMARGLYEGAPAFRAALDRACAAVEPHLGQPLLPLMFDASHGEALDRTEFTQPALFALEVALADLWASVGIVPSFVIGHSVGEVAAACVAGVMTLGDAGRLICARGRLMGALPAGGAMLAISAAAHEVAPLVSTNPELSIAAINAPAQTVVAGAAAAVEAMASLCTSRGWRAQRLKVSHAFHSPLMEPMLAEFEAVVRQIPLAAPRLRLVSNLSGALATAKEITSPAYWRRHVRETVRFADGAAALLALGADVVLEIGPHPALLALVSQQLPLPASQPGAGAPSAAPLVASMRRGRADRESWLEALAALYLAGAPIDWRAVHTSSLGERTLPIALPSYPFQRERCWFASNVAADGAARRTRTIPAGHRAAGHPLLGAPLRSAGSECIFETRLAADAPHWLAQHRVQGHVVLPATAYLDMLLAAATTWHGAVPSVVLEDITVQEAMLLPGHGVAATAAPGRIVQLVAEAPADGSRRLRICSRADDAGAGHVAADEKAAPDGGDAWICHVTARAQPASASSSEHASGLTLAMARQACSAPVEREAFYARLRRCGLDFGPAFHSVQRLWRGDGSALGEIVLAPELAEEAQRYHCHPVLLDGCLQVMAAAVAADDGTEPALFMPLAIGRYRLLSSPGGGGTARLGTGRCFAHVVATSSKERETRRADVRIFGAEGEPLAELVDVQLKRVAAAGLTRLLERASNELIYEMVWREVPRDVPAEPHGAGPAASSAPSAVASHAELPALAAMAREAITAQAAAVGLGAFDACLPYLDRLCAELVAKALVELGHAGTRGMPLDAPTLAHALDVAPRHRQLLARLLAILGEQGWLQPDGAKAPGRPGVPAAWRIARAFGEADPEAAERALHAAAASAGATSLPIAHELELTLNTGRALAAALRGRADPLQLLFPRGSTETAERVYRDSPPARLFNSAVGVVTGAMAEEHARRVGIQAGGDAAAPLRILEIGAGTGGTTAHVLPRLKALPAGSVSYTFTDIGTSFVLRGRERFGAELPTGAMEFRTFDLERDPAAQGLTMGGYDIVLASNVVHATRDLRQSLARIRALLAPGGTLAMLEATAQQAWFDLTVGLTEGWWLFSDRDLRPDYPTLGRSGWVQLLGECGFGVVHAVAGELAPGATCAASAVALNSLLLARVREAGSYAPQGHHHGSSAREWLLLADRGGVAQRLAERLVQRGESAELLGSDWLTTDALQARLRQWHAEGKRWQGVVHAAALDETAEAPHPGDAAPRVWSAGLLSALAVAPAVAKLGQPTQLALLTRGAVCARPGEDGPSARPATLWGLARALRLEHPELHCRSIDLDPGAPAGEIDAVLAELDDATAGALQSPVLRGDARGPEPQLALRAGRRLAARLVRAGRTVAAPRPAAGAWRLEPAERGSLAAFVRAPHARRAPGTGEIEIAVEATGLNFKDVLNALGMYPGDPGPLGGECAGRVTAVGPGVIGLAPGDDVLACAAGCFASHVVTRAEYAQRRPRGISAEEGASFAIAYLTAEFCLAHLAGLGTGQSVLIHAAAGGVGMAAVRLALRTGAKVFATAGTPWKRELLATMGVPPTQIFDSRSGTFGEQVLAATAGRGVDVVLNSLAGDLIEPSFAALAYGGTFVEIGKRHIKTHEWVRSLGRGIRYHIVDWGETARREPALVGGMLARLAAGLADGSLHALPRHVFALDDAARAFRFMAQARHVGRIVLRHDDAPPWVPSRSGTYLVSGGLSGLGLATAAWLGEQGAGRLVLVGRRGVTPEAAAVLGSLRERGVHVVAEALDISDEPAVAALLTRVRASGHPLRGVWHSAGQLDDAALAQQDERRFARVIGPKAAGAAVLDRLTRVDALETFVLYSSVAGVLGSAGQANHSAASAYLDALAHRRRARGLPGLAIDWGAWRDIGSAAGRGIAERLEAQGLATMSPTQALAAMSRLLSADPTRSPAQAAVLSIDWPTYVARTVPGGRSALLDDLVREGAGEPTRASAESTTRPETGRDESAGSRGGCLARLAQAPAARKRSVMASFVHECSLAVLGLDAQRAVDPTMPLGELGLDSLLAVELRNALSSALGLPLPATLLFDHPTIDALTDHLISEVLGEVSTPAAAERAVQRSGKDRGGATVVESIEDLSDEEVERQLAARARSRART